MARPQTDFFIYPVIFNAAQGNAIAAGGVQNQVLTIDASADFVWYYGCYAADVAAAGQTQSTRTFPLLKVLITPTDTSAQFMQAAVPVTSLFGIAENPFVMPAPRLIPARSALNFQVTNYDAAQTYNLYLSLIGVKKYVG